MPGVTRDRRQAGADWRGRAFQLVDTGGIDEADPTPMGARSPRRPSGPSTRPTSSCSSSTRQAGAAAGDLEVAERLRRTEKPVIVVANKADDRRQEVDAPRRCGRSGWAR